MSGASQDSCPDTTNREAPGPSPGSGASSCQPAATTLDHEEPIREVLSAAELLEENLRSEFAQEIHDEQMDRARWLERNPGFKAQS